MPPIGQFALIPAEPGTATYTEDLRERAEFVLNGTNLVEAILYSHLLLERALELRLQARFQQPDVLTNPRLARLTFAQKVTVYTGLYDPADDQVALLQALNRLRNRIAHTLVNPEETALQCLPDTFRSVPLGPDTLDGTALRRVQAVFLRLAFAEFQAIEGVHRVDLGVGIFGSHVRPGTVAVGFRRLILMGDERQMPR